MPCFTLEIHPRYPTASPVDTRRRKRYEVGSALWAFRNDPADGRWEPVAIVETGERLKLKSMIDDAEFTLPANEVQLHCARTAPKHGARMALFNTEFRILRDLTTENYAPRVLVNLGIATLERLNRFRLTYYRLDYTGRGPKVGTGDSVWLSLRTGRWRAKVVSVGAEIGVAVNSGRAGIPQLISVEPHRLDADLETVRAGDWLGFKIGYLTEFDGEIYTSSNGWRGDREKLFEQFEKTEPEVPDDFDPNRMLPTWYPDM